MHRRRFNCHAAGALHRMKFESKGFKHAALAWLGAPPITQLHTRRGSPSAPRPGLHLGDCVRPSATPKTVETWPLASLPEKLIKIGAKVVSHGRHVSFQMVEVAGAPSEI